MEEMNNQTIVLEDKEPNYVLKFNEGRWRPINYNKNDETIKKWLKPILIIIVVFGLLGINLLAGMGSMAVFLLITLSSKVFLKKAVLTPSPAELRFYDDKLVAYFPEIRNDDGSLDKSKIVSFKYDAITRCELRLVSKKLHIYGDGTRVDYKYQTDGVLSTVPSKDISAKNALLFIYVTFEPEIDFVKEIEEHSPIKVTLRNV